MIKKSVLIFFLDVNDRCCFATLFNIPVWMHLFNIINNLDGVKLGFIISLPVFLISALNFVFTPFSFRYIFKPFFVFCLSVVPLLHMPP
ncbi:putative membrane protein [Escherichia coli DEC8A]|nr:putative membrane protein [Escherichia coli DEC8A]